MYTYRPVHEKNIQLVKYIIHSPTTNHKLPNTN